MLRLFIALVFAVFSAATAFSESIAGVVRVVDGDTIGVGDVKIRLFGIDAQEIGQPCELADGRVWACGRWAKAQAFTLYQGAWAICERRDTDGFGRTVAICRVDGADMGARLVRDGIAEAYRNFSLDYVDAEKAAFFERLGLWRGRVSAPSEYRASKVNATFVPDIVAPDSSCAIKGNISANGQIYHLPRQKYYARTVITPLGNERWFCSEAQAHAAGWRRAQR